MTPIEFTKYYNGIIYSLDHKELKESFNSLRYCITQSKQFLYLEQLDMLEETYINLLQYQMNGVKDPMQGVIYRNLLISTYELVEALSRTVLTKESSIIYYTKRRMLIQDNGATYDELHNLLLSSNEVYNYTQFDAALSALFTKIWASDPLSESDKKAINEILLDEELSYLIKCQIVSALMLSLHHAFDAARMMLLFNAAKQLNNEVRIRAIICILIILSLYKNRTSLYAFIPEQLDELAEDSSFLPLFRMIILKFILSRDTEKITKKLQQDIIPAMMKLSPQLDKKLGYQDSFAEEANPEWKKELESSGISDKLKEFTELQMEGADVMHSSFIHLKSYPFFNEVSNWFLPFFHKHSSIQNNTTLSASENSILNSITDSSFVCNSDKYSIFFSLMNIPAKQREMIASQFNGEQKEIMKAKREELDTQRSQNEVVVSQYIQDLYRFYKIYPRHLDFADPFNADLEFHKLPLLQKYISDTESITILAEYYLAKEHFEEARSLFEKLSSRLLTDATYYQKIGYCFEMSGQQEEALRSYLHADLLDGDNKWTLRRLSKIYRTTNQIELSLACNKRLEVMNPENAALLLNIGHCYLSLKNYDEALKYFFKADFIDDGSIKIWRAIAWCSFLISKFEQSERYYQKILDAKPNTYDYMNAGHIALVLNKYAEAIRFYKYAVQKHKNDYVGFSELFKQDIPELLLAGISESDIPLILDQLLYTLND